MSKLFFHTVTSAILDPVFGLTTLFEADHRVNKINLGVGQYRNEKLMTPVLESVKLAETFLLREEESKEYLPIAGDARYLNKVGALVFGEFFWARESRRVSTIQALGGTGALRVGGEFLKLEVGERVVISDPTWPNHRGVFTSCKMAVDVYPYYDMRSQKLEFDRMVQYLKNLTPGTTVVLHACCHNPTGADLSMDQWKSLLKIFKENGLLPFFDFAYQGFGSSIEEDAKAIRLFAAEGIEMLVACSHSKNFGLYSERIGALYVVTESAKIAKAVESKLKIIARTNYSNPPRHGAAIVSHILSEPMLKKMWEQGVAGMQSRIEKMRRAFVEALSSRSMKRNYLYLAERVGMFCFSGLKKEEVERLQKEFAIYMPLDGRINLAGLSNENLLTVVDAITEVSR
ncbi:MAG TPA: amino acid aminotransferase [Rhabdochlamydiaceae bacterium]|jgi:aspartate/tyrosine/aromatic aminotransferase|nr:amino acid aminotransferase [Rhabdochlamydiaceae bacterium]